MDAMIKIAIEKDAVLTVTESIMKILNTGQEQETLRKALDAFTQATRITNTTIAGNVLKVVANDEESEEEL